MGEVGVGRELLTCWEGAGQRDFRLQWILPFTWATASLCRRLHKFWFRERLVAVKVANPTPEEHRPPITQQDVARALGIADSTVSRALRNNPRIPEARRRQIQAKAEEMGYHINSMAAALSHCRTARGRGSIGAVIAWLNSWERPENLRRFKQFDLYWRGASSCAEKFGYRIEEFVVNEKMPFHRVEQILLARGIPGILIPPGPFLAEHNQMHWDRFAIVRLGWVLESLPVHTVTSNQAANAMLAFRRAQALGYERIGFVGYRGDAWMFGAGFLWAQVNLPEHLRLPVLLLPSNIASVNQEPLVAWLTKTKPDAIISENPDVPKMLELAGYRVPDDIGLATVNVLDCPVDAGIDQNPEEIGRAAMLVLISLINDNDRGVPPTYRQIQVAGKWIDGTSLPARSAPMGQDAKRGSRTSR